MTRTNSPTDTRRHRITTGVAIGAVALAGLFAVGANLGVLTDRDEDGVGTLSAAADLAPAVPPALGTPGGLAGSSPGQGSVGVRRFEVDAAGTVDVSILDGRAIVEGITPADGWTARAVAATDPQVAVRFTNGQRTLELTARPGAEGTPQGDVTELAPPPASAGRDHDDEDEDDEHDEQDGRERYEGADDDD